MFDKLLPYEHTVALGFSVISTTPSSTSVSLKQDDDSQNYQLKASKQEYLNQMRVSTSWKKPFHQSDKAIQIFL